MSTLFDGSEVRLPREGKSGGSPPRDKREIEPSQPKRGWQQRAMQAVEDTFFWKQGVARSLPGGSSSPKVTVRPSRIRHVDSRNRSGSCCVDASDSQFLRVRAPVNVATFWTSMAIIEERVRKQGFWVEKVFFWIVQRHKVAEKQGGCRRTCFGHCRRRKT